ncbi:pumilio and CPL domain-containing protein penguin [Cotesia typhae]|uniref:pumilio and CPL domain-containing protein penguin n=1 Tax=Cotesia typhae TaxID=2053667 RepID=UPI003D686549
MKRKETFDASAFVPKLKKKKELKIKEEPKFGAAKQPGKPDKKSKFSKPSKPPSKFDKKVPKYESKTSEESTEKPDWKEIKKERKELRAKRKSKKLDNIYDISIQGKKIDEEMRRKDCPSEERTKLCQKLFKLFEGNLVKLVFSHDISRVIQILIKYSSPEMLASVAAELKPSFLNMIQSKYARNCIKKFFKYGTEQIRSDIFATCQGHVVQLMSHSVAAPIMDYILYKKNKKDKNKKCWASEQVRSTFKQEFYGNMYRTSKDSSVKCLSDVFAKAPDMKSATLSAVKMNVTKILSKNPNCLLIHSVLAEYLTICEPNDRAELIGTLKDSVVELLATKDGAKVAMICMWHGTAKERKAMLKVMKEQVKEIATSEYGYLFLLAMLDSVDDTVLVKKIFVPEFLSHLQEIVASEHGKKVVLYLVARRDTHYFHPALISLLSEGDSNLTSKKPADIRAKELLEAVIEPMLESISGDVKSWLADGPVMLVTHAILKAASGNGEKLVDAWNAIAAFLVNEESTLKHEEADIKAVEHPALHLVLKKLIVADKERVEKEETSFGDLLVQKMTSEVIKRWVEFNRACFLIVLLLENERESVVIELKNKLKDLIKEIKRKKHKGADVLLKKIK